MTSETIDKYKKIKVAKVWAQANLLNHTRYFFKKRNNRKFIIGDHHKKISDAIEKVIAGNTKRLIINIAPRYGKTEVGVINFISHALSLNPSALFLHLSYSNDLALNNSEEIRDIIGSESFQELFPEVQIKKGSFSKKKWFTTRGGGVYATASGGQVTGFGAGQVQEDEEENDEDLIDEFEKAIESKKGFGGAIVIDDPIKPDDADNPNMRDKINRRFDSTIRNRVNSRNTPIIIVMQRLHPEDLCGYLIENDPDEWEVLSLPCLIETEDKKSALWDYKHTVQELLNLRKMNQDIFDRQYQQDPKPLEGLLYTKFREWDYLPKGIIKRGNYTDTADQGDDYLCSINYVVDNEWNIYVTDILYTQKPMEHTEPKTAEMIDSQETRQADIESNNGGKGFSRQVKRLLQEMGNDCNVLWFHQSANKESRILTNASQVNKIFMPQGWSYKYPIFYKHITEYKRLFKANKYDDGPDALTGVYEKNAMTKKRRGVKVR